MEPIAKRLRQSAESALAPAAKPHGAAEDVAARIRRLEAELQQPLSGDSSSDSSSDSSDSDSSSDNSSGGNSAGDSASGVVSLSALADERVAALPASLLPARGASSAVGRGAKRGPPTNSPAELPAPLGPRGKVPFACKPCSFVGADMAAFEAHRRSAAHAERAAQPLRCALCAKSFTSAAQLAEHRAGKWHQQRARRRREGHAARVCFDFARGTCARGDDCAFAHAEASAARRVCASFARGSRCRFGDKCLFRHS